MSIVLLALKEENLDPEQVNRVKELVGDRQVVITDDEQEIERVLEDIEIAAGGFPTALIERALSLKWFQQWAAGADWLEDNPAAVEKDFILTNASGVHSIPISEHIVTYLLAFARDLPSAIRAQQAHQWQKNDRTRIFELAGKVMLLVGVGAIGKRTAEISTGLGMRVWGVRRNPDQSEPGIERMVSQSDFENLLPEVDFVVLTVPETDETRCMMNRETLQKMKPEAYLINIGRGGTVDEAALVEALRSRKIAGAGLDVFDEEPLPPDSPLWDMENVIITAHTAGDTPHYNQRAMDIFIENLLLYTKDQPITNVVDKKLGY